MHVLYVLNTYVKFRINRMLFTIRFINLFFMHNIRLQNFEFKYLIDTKFDIRVKNIKNMQSDDYIFKLYRHVNFF